MARVIVIFPIPVSRAAWLSDRAAMLFPRVSRVVHIQETPAGDGAHEMVNDW